MIVHFNKENPPSFCGSRTIVKTITKKAETSLKSDSRKLNIFIKQLEKIKNNDSINFNTIFHNEFFYEIKWKNNDTSESKVTFSRPKEDSLHWRLGGRVLGQMDLVETKDNKVIKTTIGIFKENSSKVSDLVNAIAKKAGRYEHNLQLGINNLLNLCLARSMSNTNSFKSLTYYS